METMIKLSLAFGISFTSLLVYGQEPTVTTNTTQSAASTPQVAKAAGENPVKAEKEVTSEDRPVKVVEPMKEKVKIEPEEKTVRKETNVKEAEPKTVINNNPEKMNTTSGEIEMEEEQETGKPGLSSENKQEITPANTTVEKKEPIIE